MRTIENLMRGKKTITNNDRVQRDALLSEDRFPVYEGLDVSCVSTLLNIPLADPEAWFDDYSIRVLTPRQLLLDKHEVST